LIKKIKKKNPEFFLKEKKKRNISVKNKDMSRVNQDFLRKTIAELKAFSSGEGPSVSKKVGTK